jgi:DNA-binding transcriptional regulator YiaG
MTPAEFRGEIRALGLSQRALAATLGLAISTVNRWAVGQADVPQYAVAYLEERRLRRDASATVAAMSNRLNSA